jgi:uncharacterized protein (DUF427 family)
MTDKQVLIPGPDHPITVTPAHATITVRLGDRVIAKTDDALVLQESTYPAAYYLPLDAVDPDVLEPSTHHTYCPYKGDASYYSLRQGETFSKNAVWSYVTPYDAVSEIAGHVAFYPDRVDITTGDR